MHNVNDIAFDADGNLLVAKGDDDMTFAERLDGTTIHGAILRIELDATALNGRYRIPADNPFVGNTQGIIEEIYAYGFRNPWRLAIDRDGGNLFVADIGEDSVEEINRVDGGEYYGWIDKEGSFAFLNFGGVSDDLTGLPADFDGVDPITEYDHSQGRRSISGGFVYRGELYPALQGHYIFADWLSGELMHVDPGVGVIQVLQLLAEGDTPTAGTISVREDQAGELIMVTTEWNNNATGQLLRWVANDTAPTLDEAQAHVDEDQSVEISITGNFTPQTVTVETQPTLGSVSSTMPLTYVPAPDVNGTDTFTISATDSADQRSNTATITVHITPVPDAPVAQPAVFAVETGRTLTAQLTATDADDDTLTFHLAADARHGEVTLNTSGTFSYVADSVVTDTFQFLASDGSLNSTSAEVTINVRASDDTDDEPDSAEASTLGPVAEASLLLVWLARLRRRQSTHP